MFSKPLYNSALKLCIILFISVLAITAPDEEARIEYIKTLIGALVGLFINPPKKEIDEGHNKEVPGSNDNTPNNST